MTPIRIAQIGVGYWGPNLLRNLVTSSDFEVCDVVELSDERRAFVKSNYPQISVSDSVEPVLARDEVDAVVIATPAATHFELVCEALRRGKHVLVEKPMARSTDEVDRISQLATKLDRVAMVGHTFLYNSAVRMVKDLVDSGELGEIRYIYSQRLNLGRIRSDVDALWNLAPHDISIIQYWLNEAEPVSVHRHGVAHVQDGIEDVTFLSIHYPNNVLANVHVSWLDPQKVRRATIVGSKKMVVYDDMAENKIAIYDKGIDRLAVLGQQMDFDDPRSFKLSHRSGDLLMPKLKWTEPLSVEISHFADCIRNNVECVTGCDHARNVIKILSSGNKEAE